MDTVQDWPKTLVATMKVGLFHGPHRKFSGLKVTNTFAQALCPRCKTQDLLGAAACGVCKTLSCVDCLTEGCVSFNCHAIGVIVSPENSITFTTPDGAIHEMEEDYQSLGSSGTRVEASEEYDAWVFFSCEENAMEAVKEKYSSELDMISDSLWVEWAKEAVNGSCSVEDCFDGYIEGLETDEELATYDGIEIIVTPEMVSQGLIDLIGFTPVLAYRVD